MLRVWSGTRGLLVISFLSGLGSRRSAGTPCPMGQKSILETVNALGGSVSNMNRKADSLETRPYGDYRARPRKTPASRAQI